MAEGPMSERATSQRRQGWLYPTFGAAALVLFGIGVGWLAFGGARLASSSSRTASKEVETMAHAAGPQAGAQTLNVVNRAEVDAAQAVLAKGFASHRWTHASRRELNAALSGATREQRVRIQEQLIRGFNSGELQYDPESD